jgi:phosphoribosyl 1,2-cyclic phosphodiesterase
MTTLTFLGTKGEIEESTPVHMYNSSMLLAEGSTRLLIDYGHLRPLPLEELDLTAVLITHAHPDHYAWLREDIRTELPVYLTRETLDYSKYLPVNPRLVVPGEELSIGPCRILPYRVIHSIRCPTVGFKISVGGKTILYNPDLVDIVSKEAVLASADCYIGDGSAVRANLVRRRGDLIFGHTRMSTQIHWCQKAGISRIIFTHLGRETLREQESFQAAHPEALLAYDNLTLPC